MVHTKSVAGVVGVRLMIESFLQEYLPENISLIQNKCLIWFTVLPMFERDKKSVFKSKKQLIDVMLGSVYLPVSIHHALYSY